MPSTVAAERSASPTVHFSLKARSEPGVMPRVLELFAKRGLVPRKWHSVTFGPGGGALKIDLEIGGGVGEIVPQRSGDAVRHPSFRERCVEIDGTLAGRAGLLEIRGSRFPEHVEQRRTVGESAVSERVIRIDVDRTREHLPRHLEMTAAELIEIAAAAQIELVRDRVRGVPGFVHHLQ